MQPFPHPNFGAHDSPPFRRCQSNAGLLIGESCVATGLSLHLDIASPGPDIATSCAHKTLASLLNACVDDHSKNWGDLLRVGHGVSADNSVNRDQVDPWNDPQHVPSPTESRPVIKFAQGLFPAEPPHVSVVEWGAL